MDILSGSKRMLAYAAAFLTILSVQDTLHLVEGSLDYWNRGRGGLSVMHEILEHFQQDA